MLSLDTVVALAIKNKVVMDQLGEALRSDLVLANPFLRQISSFADDFLLQRRKLPDHGDWEVWLQTLNEGMIREGAKEALGRLWGVDVSGYDPEYFATNVISDLQRGAVLVARARLNETAALEPDALQQMAERVASIRSGALLGLAHLQDIDLWAQAQREDERTPTGYPTLDRLAGGWGKELTIIFADSGVGKSLWLQNAAVNCATRGKNVLHITLELGLRPQILRYYRQIAQANRGEFVNDLEDVKRRLRHWFRFAKGDIYLIELPAYDTDIDELKRVVDRAIRVMGRVDVLVLDYLDLVTPSKKNQRGSDYVDLGRLTHTTRGFCPLFDVSVLSASQAVRRPEKAGRLTMRDMGDSYGKVRGVDILLTLNQLPEEEEVHQGRLGVLKVRDSGGRGQEIPLYINRDLALIQELHHPNTIELMRRLGHLPAAPKAGAPTLVR